MHFYLNRDRKYSLTRTRKQKVPAYRTCEELMHQSHANPQWPEAVVQLRSSRHACFLCEGRTRIASRLFVIIVYFLSRAAPSVAIQGDPELLTSPLVPCQLRRPLHRRPPPERAYTVRVIIRMFARAHYCVVSRSFSRAFFCLIPNVVLSRFRC